MIKQKTLLQALDLKMSRVLHQLSFAEEAQVFGESAMEGLKIEEREALLEKTKNQKLNGAQENKVQPLVIGYLLPYQLWLRIGKELVTQG